MFEDRIGEKTKHTNPQEPFGSSFGEIRRWTEIFKFENAAHLDINLKHGPEQFSSAMVNTSLIQIPRLTLLQLLLYLSDSTEGIQALKGLNIVSLLSYLLKDSYHYDPSDPSNGSENGENGNNGEKSDEHSPDSRFYPQKDEKSIRKDVLRDKNG